MALPTNFTIIGVGGCGKTLLHKICEHDEFLEYYTGDPHFTLDIYTIDTALRELEDDTRRIENLERHIQELTPNGNCGTITCAHYDLPSIAMVTDIPDLAGEQAVRQIRANDTDLVWWLNDPKNGIHFDDLCRLDGRLRDGFAGGVYRMRAVSKAAYVKATTLQSPEFARIFEGTGSVAIIVGLGGGTGSGMFIDIAKKIHRMTPGRPIWLFGVLPASSEDGPEKLNASVALTEIEYLRLHHAETGENPFTHIILTSLDPTNFGDIQSDREANAVENFGHAFPYQFLNVFEHNENNQLIERAMDYSCFINTTGYTIEYPVEKLREMERQYDNFLRQLRTFTDCRKRLVQSVTNFYNQKEASYPIQYKNIPIPQYRPDYDAVVRYKADIAAVKRIWDAKIVSQLQLRTQERINGIIQSLGAEFQNFDNLNRFDDLHMYVEHLERAVRVADTSEWTERDCKLLSCIQDNLHILHTIGEYYQKTARLADPFIQNVHMAVMCALPTIPEIQMDLNRSINVLTSVAAEIGQKREILTNKANDTQSMDAVLEYCQHERHREEWQNFESLYVRRIDSDICTEFNSKLNEAAAQSNPPVISRERRIQHFPVPSHDRDPETRYSSEADAISILYNLETALLDYYYWSYMIIVAVKKRAANAARGIIHHLIHRGDDLPLHTFEENQQRAFDKIVMICGQNPGFGYTAFDSEFSYIRSSSEGEQNAHPEPMLLLSINFKENVILDVFNQQSRDILETMVASINASQSISDRVEEVLDAVCTATPEATAVCDKLVDTLINILDLKEENSWTKKLQESHAVLDQSCELTITVQNSKQYLEEVMETLFGANTRLFQEYNAAAAALRSTEVVGDNTLCETINKPYKTTAGNINPEVLPLLDASATLANLDSNDAGRRDIQNLVDIVRKQYRGLLSSRMLGVNSLVCNSPRNMTVRYSPKAAALCISSRSQVFFEIMNSPNEKMYIARQMTASLGLNTVEDRVITVLDRAKPWECGLTLITIGNYLENLLGFAFGGAGFCRTVYERQKNNILHHVLKLDRGQYITREFLDEETALKLAIDEENGTNVVGTILNQYAEHPIQEALSR